MLAQHDVFSFSYIRCGYYWFRVRILPLKIRLLLRVVWRWQNCLSFNICNAIFGGFLWGTLSRKFFVCCIGVRAIKDAWGQLSVKRAFDGQRYLKPKCWKLSYCQGVCACLLINDTHSYKVEAHMPYTSSQNWMRFFFYWLQWLCFVYFCQKKNDSIL